MCNSERKIYIYTDSDGDTRSIEANSHQNIGFDELERIGVLKSNKDNVYKTSVPFCSPLMDLYRRLDERDSGKRDGICGK